MLLVIDNYDSFTYNLVQYLEELSLRLGFATRQKAYVKVVRNDQITLADVKAWHPDYIVISPGPGTPDDAGISVDLVSEFAATIPMLGVCLGFQCMVKALGGNIIHAKEVMHGKTSMVMHDGAYEYFHIPQPFEATRYHSLVAEIDSLPKQLEVSAWTKTDDGLIDELMGFRHRNWPLHGVQYHPESILTIYGKKVLENFLVLNS
jgi:anthranilate synthase component 2